MDTKRKSVRWVWMTVLVVFATLVSAGVVAADHIVMPASSDSSSLSRFEQYAWALDWAESQREHEAARMVSSVDVRMSRLDRFGQYLLALELAEQARQASSVERMNSGPNDSWSRFQQYLWRSGVID